MQETRVHADEDGRGAVRRCAVRQGSTYCGVARCGAEQSGVACRSINVLAQSKFKTSAMCIHSRRFHSCTLTALGSSPMPHLIP